MKQSFLDSLKGLSVADAQNRAQAAGLPVEVYPKGAIITMQARPGILLFEDQGIVTTAAAGDPLQIEAE